MCGSQKYKTVILASTLDNLQLYAVDTSLSLSLTNLGLASFTGLIIFNPYC